MRKGREEPSRRQPAGSPAGSNVFSYYSSRSREGDVVRQHATVAPRERVLNRQWVKNLPLLLCMGVVVCSLLYCLGLDTNPKVLVASANPKTAALRSNAEYQKGAREIMSRSLLNHSKLTVDTEAFVRTFSERFPEVADASVTLPLVGRRPVISIDTAEPVLLLASDRKVFVLDARGKAIMQAADLVSSVRQDLPTVDDEGGLEVTVGRTVLPPDHVNFLRTVVAQLRTKQLAVESISLPPLAQELHVRLQGQPYFVKLNVGGDARVGVGTFLAVKQRLEAERRIPKEYIDVRIDERAYYK